MPIDFPSNPQIDELYSAEDRTWRWTGVYWRAVSTTIGYTGSQGEQGEGFRVLGSFPTVADLPNDSSGQPGDAYVITETGDLWSWDGYNWNNIGRFVGYTGSRGAQGYAGSQGRDGNFGGVTLDYTFSSNTDSSQDPGAGRIKFNDINMLSSTLMFIGDSDDDAVNLSSYLTTIDSSTSGIRGHFRISRKFYPDQFVMFAITDASIDQGSYFIINCAYVSGNLSDSSTAFDDGDDILITFARTGDKGDIGYTGSSGFTGSQGATGTSIRIVGALSDSSQLPTPYPGDIGDGYLVEDTGHLWLWDGNQWNDIGKLTGEVGPTGYTGSEGDVGYTGSEGESTFTWGPTPPEDPEIGDRWFDTIVGAVAVYVDDGDTQAWLEVAGSGFMGQVGYTGSGGGGGPRVSSIDYPGAATAADPAGGETVGIVGTGFEAGAHILLENVAVGQVSFINENRLEIVTPAKTAGTYNYLYIINPDGAAAIYVPGLQYSGVPTWGSPGAGNIGSAYETQSISQSFSASSDSSVTYSLLSGTLPAGSTLDPNTGVLSGTASNVDNTTTYTFTIRATDAESQTSDRQFSFTIDPDSITWNYPTEGAVVEVQQDTASSIGLSASAVTGAELSYTTSSLPDGLTLSGNTISGTATTLGDIPATATAYAASSDTTAVISVTWRVVLGGDQFFNQTSLLLNSDVNTFITDASDNAFTITPVADTRPSAFSPYNTSWSNYFDGNGDYLTFGDNLDIVANNFTFECFVYFTQINNTYNAIFSKYGASYSYQLLWDAPNNRWFWNVNNGASTTVTFSDTIVTGQWYYLCLERTGTSYKMYRDGGQIGTTQTISGNIADGTRPFALGITFGGSDNELYPLVGYISNFRAVIGSNVYGSVPSVPTAPLTAISGTSLLTCQSNRLVDQSINNITITRNGDVRVTGFAPFVDTDTSTGSGYFDGTGDYLSCGDILDFAGNDFTISCFVYFETINNTFNAIFSKWGAPPEAYQLLWEAPNNRWLLSLNTGSYSSLYFSDTITTGQWYYLCVERLGTSYKLYRDGNQIGSTQTVSGNITNSGNNFLIGYTTGGSNNLLYPLKGYISNFRVVVGSNPAITIPTLPLTAVSGTQLLTLQNRIGYNNSQPIDLSGIKNVITRPTGTNASVGSFSPHVPTGWSNYFNGASRFDLADSNDWDLGTTWTAEGWFYPNSTSAGKALATRRSTSTANQYDLIIFSGGTWKFEGYGVNNTSGPKGSTNTYPANQWYHIAVVTSGGSTKLYVNGVLDYTYNNNFSWTSSYGMAIGASVAFNEWWNGYISNVRIVKGTAVYTEDFDDNLPTSPLNYITNTVLLSCRDNSFIEHTGKALTVVSAPKVTPFSPFAPHTVAPDSYSVYFDGNGDYLSVPYNTDLIQWWTTDYTLEMWIWPAGDGSSWYRSIAGGSSPAPASIGNFNTSSATIANYWSFGFDNNLNLKLYYYTGSQLALISSLQVNLNQWNHIAFTKTSSGVAFFCNGVGQTAQAISGTPQSSASYNLNIGQYNGQGVIGHISNIRIVKGTAVYSGTSYPVPTSPLISITNTSLLTCQSPTVIDNSDNDFAITVNGNSQPTKFNPFGETVTTSVEYSPASHGGSVYFDGSGDYLALPTSQALPGAGDYTVEAWIYSNNISSTAEHTIIAYGTGSNNLRIQVNNIVDLRVLDGANVIINSTSVIKPLSWNHVAVVRSGSASNNIKLYVNGVFLAQGTSTATFVGTATVGGDGASRYFNGYIANLRLLVGTALYTANFVPPQAPLDPIPGTTLLTCNNNAAIQDKTGRNVLETVGKARTLPESPYRLNKSVFFDGTEDFLEIADNDAFDFGSGSFTVECWVNFAALPTASGASTFISQYSSSSATDIGWFFYLFNSAGTYQLYITYSTTGTNQINLAFSLGSAPAIGTWNHVAFVRSGNDALVFWNGTQVGSTQTLNATLFNSSRNIRIGAETRTTASLYPLYGYISNLRIVKGTALYTEDFDDNLPTSPLTAISGTQLLTCQSYNFKDNSTNNFTITRNGDARISSRGPFTETQTSDNAMYFDGTGDRLYSYVGLDPMFDLGLNGELFTVEHWVYFPVTPSAVQFSLGKGGGAGAWNSSNGHQYLMGTISGGLLYVQRWTGSALATISVANPFVGGQWYHYAVTYDGTTTRAFVNGSLIMSGATTYGKPSTPYYVVVTDTPAGDSPANCYIDDLRVTKGVAREIIVPTQPYPKK